MVGSMFYRGHKIVTDTAEGIFDTDAAAQLIRDMESASTETGLPFIVDVVGDSPGNLVKYCQFVADATTNKDQPMLLDGLSDDIRVPALKELAATGLVDRLVYNSIEPKVSDETLEAIRGAGLTRAILLAFDSTMLLPAQKLDLLHGWGDRAGVKEGLIAKAARAGVDQCVVDAAVLDMPSIGIAARTIETVRESTGLPAGCAPSNAVFECSGLDRFGESAKLTGLITACTYLVASGACFVLYGPARFCRDISLAVANADAFTAYAARRLDKTKIKAEGHPLFKIF
jgi:tetrahydromethanopterin S-methyltransferase subunit H